MPLDSSNAARELSRPYRGLDFYKERHAALFQEREEQVVDCVRLLSSYNVKILLMHGSSGAGKSSFLRAGLIPALKGMVGRRPTSSAQAVFLNAGKGVVRCTSDPTRAIAAAILWAIERESPFILGKASTGEAMPAPSGAEDTPSDHQAMRDLAGETGPKEATKAKISKALKEKVEALDQHSNLLTEEEVAAAEVAYKALAVALVDALSELCASIEGKLYLILDQAEESLTRTSSSQENNPASVGFFHFLDEAYVRNLAMRIIISVRTEYYGRFRDALRIADDRLGRRPDEGGLEPFLLRPLTDKNALVRAFGYPTTIRDREGNPIYPFNFAEGVLSHVVEDVLDWKELGKSSVTPLISMACSYLYDRLRDGKGTIELYDYPGIDSIIQDYISNGLNEAGGTGKQNVWLELLYATLVSRQGGGTVVSLIEDSEAFLRRSQEDNLGLTKEEIAAFLSRATLGTTPLLRGAPRANPVYFSLKHDAMAVRLERWRLEHKGEMARRRKMRRIKLISLVSVCVAVVVFFAVSYALRVQAMLNDAKSDIVANKVRLGLASRADASDFSLSLRLLVASHRIGHERPVSSSGKVEAIYEAARKDTVSALRQTLPRTPWFAGKYRAVGFDPVEKRLAVLRRDKLFIMSFSESEHAKAGISTSTQALVNWSSPYALPEGWLKEISASNTNVTAGFLHSLGPVVYAAGSLYYWGDPAQPARGINLRNEPSIDALFTTGVFPPTAEISGGVLILRRISGTSGGQVVRVDLTKSPGSTEPPVVQAVQVPIPKNANFLSWSDVYEQPRFAMLDTATGGTTFRCGDEPGHDDSAECALRRLSGTPWQDKEPQKPFRKVLVYVGDPALPEPGVGTIGIAYAPPVPESPQTSTAEYAYAFVSGTDKVAVIGHGGAAALYDVDAKPNGSSAISQQSDGIQLTIPDPSGLVSGVEKDLSLQLGPTTAFWQSPLFAASVNKAGSILAWNGSNGLWVAATNAEYPTTAIPVFAGTLLPGTAGGSLLKFTNDGSELVLIQQTRFGGAMSVRVWDVSAEWRKWLLSDSGATEKDLIRLACNVLIGASNVRSGSEEGRIRWVTDQVDFSDYEFNLFDIRDKDLKSPCFHVDAALESYK
jgi:hypothetical protein